MAGGNVQVEGHGGVTHFLNEQIPMENPQSPEISGSKKSELQVTA